MNKSCLVPFVAFSILSLEQPQVKQVVSAVLSSPQEVLITLVTESQCHSFFPHITLTFDDMESTVFTILRLDHHYC